MANHCKQRGTTPNVAALDPECFSRPRVRRLVFLNHLLSWPVSSPRAKFVGKLCTLRKIIALSSGDFHRAAEDLTTNAALATRDSWSVVDAAHYDLNTCLRESIVMLKCFLRVLSEEEFRSFQVARLRVKKESATQVGRRSQLVNPSKDVVHSAASSLRQYIGRDLKDHILPILI
jgi:hypothetical protein